MEKLIKRPKIRQNNISNEELEEKMDDFESLSREIQRTLRKDKITQDDKDAFYDYVLFIEREYNLVGLYAILRPEIRKLVYKNIQKISEVDGFEEDTKYLMLSIHESMLTNVRQRLDTILKLISIEELDSALEFYVEMIPYYSSNDIEMISLLKSNMKIEDFANSKTLHAFLDKLNSIDYRFELTQFDIDKIISFTKGYILDLDAKGIVIDFENDQFLKSLPKDIRDEVKRYYLLINTTITNPSIEDISTANDIIINIFENTREQADNLTDENKKMLENYFKHFYSKALAELDNMTKEDKLKFYRVIELITRSSIYGFESSDDYTFFKGIVPNLSDALNAILSQKDLDDDGFKVVALADYDFQALPVLEKYTRNMKAKDPNFDYTKLETTKIYLERMIDRVLNGKTLNGDALNFILSYVYNLVKRPDFNLFDNQYLCDILQLIRTSRLDPSFINIIEQTIDSRLRISSKDSKDELAKVYKIIKSNPSSISEADFDEMIKHLQVLKLKDYKITDKKILNYIMMQVLNENSCISKKLEKYNGFVERFLEDFALADLPEHLQNNYCFLIRDDFGDEFTHGIHVASSQYIGMKRSLSDDFQIFKDVGIINTIFHENTHAIQTDDIDSSKVDSFYRYLMTKEEILGREKRDYYNENYENIFMEIEARQRAIEKLSDFINDLPKDTKIKILQKIARKKLGFGIDEKRQQLSKGLTKTNVFKQGKPIEDISIIFDEIIKQNPDYLVQYPILQMEYNKDGSLKTLQEIFVTMENDKDDSHRALYVSIIKRGNAFKFENLESDLDFILGYDIKKASNSSSTTMIFKFMLTTLLDKIDEMSDEDKKKAYALIDKINDKLKTIEDKGKKTTIAEKAFKRALTRKNRKEDKSLIELLNEERGEKEEQEGKRESKEAKLMATAFYSTTEKERTKGKQELVESQTQMQSPKTNDENQKENEQNGQEDEKDNPS